MTKKRGRQRSGRQARKRIATEPFSVVSPGQSGGTYRPLGEADIKSIVKTAFDLVENVGLADPIPLFRQLAVSAGCSIDENTRLRIPRRLLEDTINNQAARQFTLCGFDPKHDLEISGTRVHFGIGGGAVNMLNPNTMAFEPSSLLDLYDLARLVDNLDQVHFMLRPVIPRDIDNARELDLNIAYAIMAGCSKPVSTSFADPAQVHEVIEMAEMMLGAKESFRQRPFLHATNCFVVPPLRFAKESCECLVAQVKSGMTLTLVSAGQAGSTSPAALAGTLAQSLAECLAGLVMVNLIKPGHPCLLAMFPFVSDLRTGAMTGGSAEQALLGACAAQIVNWLGLPVATVAGMTDAKTPDNQAGYEKGISAVLTAAAGANMIYESGSMLASLMASSREALVIDNDMLGMVNRTVCGVEVNDDTLSYQTIKAVVGDAGHFLDDEQTLRLMRSGFFYPALADRSSHNEWAANGKPALVSRAEQSVRQILDNCRPTHIQPAVHEEIHRNFPIHLPLEETIGAAGDSPVAET